MNRGLGLTYIALLAVMGMTACKVGNKPVHRNVTINKDTLERYGMAMVDTPGAPVRTVPKAELTEKKLALITALVPLWQKEIPFRTFSGKAKIHFEARGIKQDFTANFRVAKDEVIWVNVTALGGMVSAARVLIKPDSIFVLNMLQREVTLLAIEDANKLFPVPVDFKTFQSLILGDVIQRTGKPVDATDFGGTMTLQVDDGKTSQNIAYNKTDSVMRTLQLLSKDERGPAGMIQFGNYELINNRNFAKSRVVNVSNKGEQYYLDMNFSNISFDEELEFPFSIPKTYTVK